MLELEDGTAELELDEDGPYGTLEDVQPVGLLSDVDEMEDELGPYGMLELEDETAALELDEDGPYETVEELLDGETEELRLLVGINVYVVPEEELRVDGWWLILEVVDISGLFKEVDIMIDEELDDDGPEGLLDDGIEFKELGEEWMYVVLKLDATVLASLLEGTGDEGP